MKVLPFILLFSFQSLYAQVEYPYPVRTFNLVVENEAVHMAYMDVPALPPAKSTILLLHGKNFNGYYWKEVIPGLISKGYRLIIPDQVGWGRSGKPALHYSFHMLASNTKMLLDSLKISRVIVIGHSMGGMLATRFALMYPAMVEKLVLENPIGLEDYKVFVPYQSLDTIHMNEQKASYESYKKYQQSYYPVWKPEYEQYVMAQAESLNEPGFKQAAWVNALTYQMIYEQPVIYEMHLLDVPTMFMIGQSDRTVVGKNLLTGAAKNKYGNYPSLGKKAHEMVKGSKLIELKGVGHIPHIQETSLFLQHVLKFLDED